MITVENTGADLRVTIPRDAAPPKRLHAWLRLEELAQPGHLTEADANRLVDDLKAGWWVANKDRIVPAHEQ